MKFLNTIIDLGPSVMMPIIFFILALAFGVKIGKAFKAGMLVGIGFEGVNLVIGLLLDNLGPASQAMVERLGIDLTIIDTGWPTAATIGWGTPIMPIVVIGFIIINVLMLLFKLTKTVNIDIFNYWIFLLTGGIIYAATESVVISVIATFINFIIILVIADLTAEKIQKSYDLKGVSFPHATCAVYAPLGMMVNWIIDKIPGFRNIDINPETITERFGIFGEPITLGAILGAGLGLLAGYSITNVFSLAIKVAAAMVLLPKMIDILVSGLIIVRDSAEVKLKEKFPDREFFIGLDTALLVGEPSVLATGLLLIPVAVLLAVILPGNKVLPFVDLASLMFLISMVTPYCNRNMFRMFITGVIILVLVFYIGTDIGKFYMEAANIANVSVPGGADGITNIVGGATTPLGWILIKISTMLKNIL